MRIAVLDDVREESEHLRLFLEQFQKESNELLQVDVYQASLDFLEEFKGQYDVIFLDIEMPGEDGLAVAREIRSKDSAVAIVFVTNMAQYAIEGYKVNAVDFIVKPIGYYVFCDVMKKAMGFSRRRGARSILVNDEEGLHKVATDTILYMEKEGDKVVIHTISKSYRQRSTIKAIREKLEGLPFEECSSGIVVNLASVRSIIRDMVLVDREKLPLSRRQKKAFTQAYIEYVGGGF